MSAGRGVRRDVCNPDVHVLTLHFRKGRLKKVGSFDRCCLLSHCDLTANQKHNCPKDRPKQNRSTHSGSPIALGGAPGTILGCEQSYAKPAGSNSEVRTLSREVGFALNSGHRQPSLSGPKSTKNGLMHRHQLKPEPLGGIGSASQPRRSSSICRIRQVCDAARRRHHLTQQLDLLAAQVG